MKIREITHNDGRNATLEIVHDRQLATVQVIDRSSHVEFVGTYHTGGAVGLTLADEDALWNAAFSAKYEVRAVREEDGATVWTDDETAEHFGIYKRRDDDTYEHVADVTDREGAERILEIINNN